jgi:L-fuculose-phosphate aldolase
VKHLRLRRDLIATARRMNALAINQGTSGNLSARIAGGLLMTPSGVAYDAMAPADLVEMDFEGAWRCERAGQRPSSEWRFHRDILKARLEFGAVVHCHPINATALACLGRDIPAFHYMVAVAGGDTIRCAPYATFGSAALSEHALAALDGRKACLLANHGMIAAGADLAAALALAVEVETLAAQYCRALQVGRPKLLTKAEMERVLAKFDAGYGYASGPEPSGKSPPATRHKARPSKGKRQ